MEISIYIATSNAHKLREFSEMFRGAGLDCEVRGAGDVVGYEAPEENGLSFEENALIKADALRKLAPSHAYVMADDSGLVVDALDGAPGIYSARYAKAFGADADLKNNEKLLKDLADVPDEKRTARFVCAIALICPNNAVKIFEGKIEGVINRGEAGANGFGYDPLFYLPERGMTTAELDSAEKNKISHRGQAFQKLAEFLKSQQE